MTKILLAFIVLFLCAGASGASFLAGRFLAAPAAPEVEVVERVERETEIVTVTRVVTPETDEVLDEPAEPEQPAEPEPEDAGEDAAAPDPSETDSPLLAPQLDNDLFREVWHIIQAQFDGDIPSDEEITYAAIEGSLATLDDEFTRFVPPAIAERLRQDLSGSFEGIGAFVRMNDEGFFEIVRPIAGQPAARAGLQGGDIILAVDGESVEGMLVDEAVALVRGPRGTSVTLTVLREGEDEPFDVTIVRDRIEIPIVEAEMLEDNIAYVRLSSFNRNAEQQLTLALEQLLAQNPQALIFDLRDNPGGFLDQSVAVANLFLGDGIVLLERNNRGMDEVFMSSDGSVAEAIPLIVLVNAGSASASEIVAGAVQDRERGVIIGEVTLGKGSVQQPHTLSDGSELRVTIARWYTPNGSTIDEQGIIPDIEIGPSPMEFLGEDDIQLQRAIEYILNGE